MRSADPIGLAKAILWEEAKGKLRALVQADGAQQSGTRSGEYHFEKISRVVEEFISDFESGGFHE